MNNLGIRHPQRGQSVRQWSGRVSDRTQPLKNITGDKRYIAVESSPSGIFIRFIGRLFPRDPRVCLGLGPIIGQNVTIYGGEIQMGAEAPITVPDTTVVITVDNSLVGYDYDYANGTFTIENFGNSITYNGTHAQKWLYKFRYSGGKVNISNYGFLNPSFPSNYGDGP